MELRPGMAALRASSSPVGMALKGGAEVAFLGYPTYINVGDILIMLGTLEFFERNSIRIVYAGNLPNTALPAQGLEQYVPLVFQGGGNFGDLYPEHQEYRERLIACNPDRPVVILPQTIHFSNERALEKSMRVLDAHRDLTLFVRDLRSYEIGTRYLGERVKLAPDMAHELWLSLKRQVNPDRRITDPLLFIRDDVERGEMPRAIQGLSANFVDWASVNTIQLRLQNRMVRALERFEGERSLNLPYKRWYFNAARKRVVEVARSMSSHDTWITSRLHGVILGLLLEKYVFAIDNSYGKLFSYLETWSASVAPVGLIRDELGAREALEFARNTSGRDVGADGRYRKLHSVGVDAVLDRAAG